VFCGTFLESNKPHDIWCINCRYDIVFIFIKQVTCQIDDNMDVCALDIIFAYFYVGF